MDLLSPVNRSAYDKLNKKIHKAVKEVSLEVKDACDDVHASGGVADVDSSILLDTDVDFADVINPSVFCNDDNSSVSCDANVDSSVFSDADIVDISVSCDGTWHRRGFSSLNGTVACISMDTGKVLDIEIMSRYCQSCVVNAPLEKTNPNKFAEFRATHEPECQIIHDGSAPAMEAEGTVNIFKVVDWCHFNFFKF